MSVLTVSEVKELTFLFLRDNFPHNYGEDAMDEAPVANVLKPSGPSSKLSS